MNSSSSSSFVRRITAADGTRVTISLTTRSPWPDGSSPSRQTSGRSRTAASTADSASAASVQRASGSSARRSPTRVGRRSAAMSTCARFVGRSGGHRPRDLEDDRSTDYDMVMRVLIADDHRLIVEGVKRALEEAPDFEVVGECNSGSQVLPLVGRTNPDIVLLDLRMPGADGLACLSRIRKQHPDVKVVVLSVSTDENVIQTVLKRGASAYIVKSINPIDLPSALRQAIDGNGLQRDRPARSRRQRGARRRPHRARDRDPHRPRARPLERGDRQGALGRGADGQVPPDEHLPQARRLEPHRGRAPRVPERARREPDRRPLSWRDVQWVAAGLGRVEGSSARSSLRLLLPVTHGQERAPTAVSWTSKGSRRPRGVRRGPSNG